MSAVLADTASEFLVIRETLSIAAGPVREDGTVPLHIIRPGIGRGKGRHLYEADMLAANAHVFAGWKMYVDHQSPEAKRRAGGLPRSLRDLGGVIKEAWWDPSVPADPSKGWGQGAVVGLAKPTRFVRSLIEDDPALVEASISATATGVRPIQRDGQTVWLVEGINPKGSVDWVTEAGAGGRVVSLMEALQESMTTEEEEREVLDQMTDPELAEQLKAERPELVTLLLEEAKKPDAEDDPAKGGDGGSDEMEELTQKYLKKFNGNRKMAEQAAKRELAQAQEGTTKEDDVTVTPDALAEALATDEGKAALAPVIRDLFADIVAPTMGEIVEAALSDEREMIQAEADAGAKRMLQVRDLRDHAHRKIAETKLPEIVQQELREQFEIVGEKPTAALDVVEDCDDSGEVTKTAVEKLNETLETAISKKRELVAALSPTRVTGQGPSKAKTEIREGGEGDAATKPDGEGAKKKVEEQGSTGSARTDFLLREAGFSDEDLGEMYEL